MKQINFINHLTAANQRAITRWYYVSITACSLLICVLSVITWQLYQHTNTVYDEWSFWQQKAAALATNTSTYDALKKREANLTQYKTKITQCAANNKRMAQQLRILASLATDITSIHSNQQAIDIRVQCKQPQQAQQIVSTLKKTGHFPHLQVHALTHSQDCVLATLTTTHTTKV